jgi:hypothetical protein
MKTFHFKKLTLIAMLAAMPLTAINSAQAGIICVSRANCTHLDINESISYEPFFWNNHWLWTTGVHYKKSGKSYTYSDWWTSKWNYTARSYVGDRHPGDQMYVLVMHWTWKPTYGVIFLGYTRAIDCNLLPFAIPQVGALPSSVSDFVNQEVNGNSAVLSIRENGKGKSISELTWSTGQKLYVLGMTNNISKERKKEAFMDVAQSIQD